MRQEAERPPRQDEEPVLESDQVEEMDDEPAHPRREPTKVNALDVGDGFGPADRGEVALVDVAQRQRRAAAQPVSDRASCVASLLHSDGCDAGERDNRAAGRRDAHHVTAPAEDGDGGFRAMVMALQRSGLSPADIDYVNSHGTSTPLGDEIELKAIQHFTKYCHQCQMHAKSPGRFKFILKEDHNFNFEIIVDIMYLEG